MFCWSNSQANESLVVVNEATLFDQQLKLKDKISGKKLLVHCKDSVDPYFSNQRQDFVNFLADTRTDDDFLFISVNHYPEFEKFSNYYYFPEYHAYYYPMYQGTEIDDRFLEKKFLSLNKREDPTRQLLYVKFYHDNLLDSSYFSYLGENNQYQNLYTSAEWDTNWEILKSNIPEVQSWKIPPTRHKKIDNDQLLEQYRGTNSHGTSDPTWMSNNHWYQTSFCSIICETAPSAHKPNFSEKTFRAIMHGHIFIIIGAENSIKLLRQLGFDVFDDIIDHEYDVLHHYPFCRQQQAFKQIDHIAQYTLEELLEIKKSLYSRRINNIKNYQRLYNLMLDKHNLIFEKIKQYVQS